MPGGFKSPPNMLDRMFSKVFGGARDEANRKTKDTMRRVTTGASNPKFKKPKGK